MYNSIKIFILFGDCMLPQSIDIRITRKCNLNCSFCFGTKCKNNELCISDWKMLLERFKLHGVKCVIITGGEPTLYPWINRLISFAKSLDYYVVLSTNGTLPIDNEILENIDVLSIPIDGECYEDCYRMRQITRNDYNTVMYNISSYKRYFPNSKLKIGTVITKINIDNVSNIFYLIKHYADIWKLYQVSRHKNNNHIYENELSISDYQFESIKKRIIQMNEKNEIKTVFYKSNERDGKYLFCEPNGDAMVIKNDEEIIIGSFINDFNKVLNNWRDYVDLARLNENLTETYF